MILAITIPMQILSPIATLLVGCLVGYIAWQQWQVARSKLRLDLFDRRYKVFEATRKFLSVIVREAKFEPSDFFEFNAGTADAEFLFGTDVVVYLKQVRKRAIHMQTHQKAYEHLPVGEKRSQHVQAEHEQLLWIGDQFTVMTEIFTPYLGFSHVK